MYYRTNAYFMLSLALFEVGNKQISMNRASILVTGHHTFHNKNVVSALARKISA